MDFRWTSQGGVLVDGTGDIATTLTATEELETMVATRLKAAINGWQLYQIGADLDSFKGSPIGINQNTRSRSALTPFAAYRIRSRSS